MPDYKINYPHDRFQNDYFKQNDSDSNCLFTEDQ